MRQIEIVNDALKKVQGVIDFKEAKNLMQLDTLNQSPICRDVL